jgi:hypothetical protein
MPTTRRRRCTLAELLEEDSRNKKRLNEEFPRFQTQVKRLIQNQRDIKEVRDLRVPLERLDRAVRKAAYGFDFCTDLVKRERISRR